MDLIAAALPRAMPLHRRERLACADVALDTAQIHGFARHGLATCHALLVAAQYLYSHASEVSSAVPWLDTEVIMADDNLDLDNLPRAQVVCGGTSNKGAPTQRFWLMVICLGIYSDSARDLQDKESAYCAVRNSLINAKALEEIRTCRQCIRAALEEPIGVLRVSMDLVDLLVRNISHIPPVPGYVPSGVLITLIENAVSESPALLTPLLRRMTMPERYDPRDASRFNEARRLHRPERFPLSLHLGHHPASRSLEDTGA